VTVYRPSAVAAVPIAVQSVFGDGYLVHFHHQIDAERRAGLLLAVFAVALNHGEGLGLAVIADMATQAATVDGGGHGCSPQLLVNPLVFLGQIPAAILHRPPPIHSHPWPTQR